MTLISYKSYYFYLFFGACLYFPLTSDCRSLAGEIAAEFTARREAVPPQSVDDLNTLVDVIVPFGMCSTLPY